MWYKLKIKNSFRAKHYGWTVPDTWIYSRSLCCCDFLFFFLLFFAEWKLFSNSISLSAPHLHCSTPSFDPTSHPPPHANECDWNSFLTSNLKQQNSKETIRMSLSNRMEKEDERKEKKKPHKMHLCLALLHFVDSPTMQVGCRRLRKHACDVLSMAMADCVVALLIATRNQTPEFIQQFVFNVYIYIWNGILLNRMFPLSAHYCNFSASSTYFFI